VEAFLDIMRRQYEIKVDWKARQYLGLTLEWDYAARTCDISMPGYIERALQRFLHPKPTRPQDSPHTFKRPEYGAKSQYAEPEDTTPALDLADQKRVQEVIGVLLFYARAVDNTLLVALSSIATQQAKGTRATMNAITHILNYCASHPDAVVRFHASDMVLWVDSDGSYLSESKARSRAGGYFYLSSRPRDPTSPPSPNDPPPPHNGPIHIHCSILREICSSAAEAELGALFHNGKEACPLRIALEELGHTQPPTPLQTDNSTAFGVINDTVKQRRTKAMDMRFYWTRDRVRQGQFHVYWRPGKDNKADYFTKHHPTTHHRAMRPTYLQTATQQTKNQNYYDCLTAKDPDPAIESSLCLAPSHHELQTKGLAALGAVRVC